MRIIAWLKHVSIIFVLLVTITTPLYALNIEYHIDGLDEAMQENAQQRLSVITNAAKPLTPQKIQTLFNSGEPEILEAIKPYGYFNATIPKKNLSLQKNNWIAYYKVKLNTPVRVTKLTIEITGAGNQDKHILYVRDHLALKAGEVFNVPKYEAARNDLILAAQKRGYIKAQMQEDKIIIHLNKYSCHITLILNTGLRYYFGPTSFEKNPLSDQFLKRYLNYKEGQPFSANKLIELQNNLSGAGYYQAVNVSPQLDKIQNQQVPVNVALTPAKRKQYQFGIGYGTATGARGTAGINWRWVNRFGDKFSANAIWSTVTKNITAQYAIPAHDPVHGQYVINGTYMTLHPHGGNSIVKKVGAGYIYQHGHWQYNYGTSFLLERYRIDSEGFYRSAHVLLPTFNLGWNSSKPGQLVVNNGASFNLLVQGGYRNALSSVSFLQTDVKGKIIQTFWDDNRFIVRANWGYTVIQDARKLPLSLRFYTGGPTTLRGFAVDGIGPGRFLTVASAEYQRRIVGNWYAAVFYDAGNAFDSYADYIHQIKRSTGAGVVWQSPIGNVSMYVARALTTKGRPLRLEFSLGADQ